MYDWTHMMCIFECLGRISNCQLLLSKCTLFTVCLFSSGQLGGPLITLFGMQSFFLMMLMSFLYNLLIVILRCSPLATLWRIICCIAAHPIGHFFLFPHCLQSFFFAVESERLEKKSLLFWSLFAVKFEFYWSRRALSIGHLLVYHWVTRWVRGQVMIIRIEGDGPRSEAR